jgi:hypothetical protein
VFSRPGDSWVISGSCCLCLGLLRLVQKLPSGSDFQVTPISEEECRKAKERELKKRAAARIRPLVGLKDRTGHLLTMCCGVHFA